MGPRTGRGRRANPGGQPRGNLTAREIEILRLLAMGKSSKEIAPLLDITDKTVRNHLSNMYRKLHVYDRVQALLFGVESGLVTLGHDQQN